MKRNVLLIPHLCLNKQKDSQQDVVHSSALDRKQSGILFTMKDQDENGAESVNWLWSNLEEADTQFSEPRVHVPEQRSKAKEVVNYRYISVLMRDTIETIFARLFLLTSFVSTEQSQICVKNTVLVKQERWDLCWQDNLTHCPSQQDYWWITSLIPSIERSRDQDLYWCRILDSSWRRTVFHDQGHWRVLTIYRTSDMSWVHVATRRKINWLERLDSREHQNWTRVRSHNQLFAR